MLQKLFILFFVGLTVASFGKVYDCFMFANELEVLEIRLNEMAPYVDYFVLVEWNRCHRKNNIKPYVFEENKEKFAQFLPKIVHIKLSEVIETEDAWLRENWHRNQIMQGLTECDPEDIVLVSDVDEIIPGEIIPKLSSILDEKGKVGFWQILYQWFLNRKSHYQMWSGTYAIKYKDLIQTTPQKLRNAFRFESDLPRLQAGWHFSSMGGYKRAKEKHYNIVEGVDEWFAEDEWYGKFVQETTKIVQIDPSFPRFVQENLSNLTKNGLIDVKR